VPDCLHACRNAEGLGQGVRVVRAVYQKRDDGATHRMEQLQSDWLVKYRRGATVDPVALRRVTTNIAAFLIYLLNSKTICATKNRIF